MIAQIAKKYRLILALSISLIVCGCSHWIYHPPVQQGNVITAKMLKEVHKGMTPQEVYAVMGSPVLIDTFRDQRWHYVYTLEKRGDLIQRDSVTLVFRKNRLQQVIKGRSFRR